MALLFIVLLRFEFFMPFYDANCGVCAGTESATCADDATCAEIKMSHLGVSHLALGQADLEPARLKSGLGVGGVELIMHWGRGQKGGISLEGGALPACWIDPPTVTNKK